ncbi:MAG TPA: hypothetical protein VHS59_03050 [Bacillota bacterium]|nr:hypothetical protein [Bacillota bacterium]
MGIDFIIARFCPVKDTLGDYFLSMVKKRAKLDYLELFRMDHPDFNEETVFEEVEDTPDCTYRRQTTMAAIREELVHLEEWQGVCSECGANFTYHTGGCWGYIPYPLPELLEKQLIATIQTLADGDGNQRAAAILDSLREYASQSETIQDWRTHELTELKKPLSHTWGGMLTRRRTVTTDQLLEYIFDRNMLESEELDKVTVFLEFLQRCLKESPPPAARQQEPAPGDKPQPENVLRPFLQFIKACQIADELGEGIYIIP